MYRYQVLSVLQANFRHERQVWDVVRSELLLLILGGKQGHQIVRSQSVDGACTG
jgi:hypothetical protein